MLETFKVKKHGGYKRNRKKDNSLGQVGNSFGGGGRAGGGGYIREVNEDRSSDFGRGDVEQVIIPIKQKIGSIEQKRRNNNYRDRRI
jgi:hypothetical protein